MEYKCLEGSNDKMGKVSLFQRVENFKGRMKEFGFVSQMMENR